MVVSVVRCSKTDDFDSESKRFRPSGIGGKKPTDGFPKGNVRPFSN